MDVSTTVYDTYFCDREKKIDNIRRQDLLIYMSMHSNKVLSIFNLFTTTHGRSLWLEIVTSLLSFRHLRETVSRDESILPKTK